MARTADQWYAILTQCGVREAVAATWAPVFEHTIKEGTFSQGDAELDEFLGQILHESQGLEYMKEKLNYRPERIQELGMKSPVGSRWRSLVPRAMQLGNNPPALAEAVYGGRMGNGPEGSGDGWSFIGRSPLMITGFDNYHWLGNLMGQDLTVLPHLLEQPHYALEATILWWENRIPDTLLGSDPHQEVLLRKRVNGGTFGLDHTRQLAETVRRVLAQESA